MKIPSHLLSPDGCEDKLELCAGACAHPVGRDEATGRFYITMGHPGFNSRANNGTGYITEAAARLAMGYYGAQRAT